MAAIPTKRRAELAIFAAVVDGSLPPTVQGYGDRVLIGWFRSVVLFFSLESRVVIIEPPMIC
jgi:hypothetical protein